MLHKEIKYLNCIIIRKNYSRIRKRSHRVYNERIWNALLVISGCHVKLYIGIIPIFDPFVPRMAEMKDPRSSSEIFKSMSSVSNTPSASSPRSPFGTVSFLCLHESLFDLIIVRDQGEQRLDPIGRHALLGTREMDIRCRRRARFSSSAYAVDDNDARFLSSIRDKTKEIFYRLFQSIAREVEPGYILAKIQLCTLVTHALHELFYSPVNDNRSPALHPSFFLRCNELCM